MCMLTTSIPSLGGLFRNIMTRKTGRHDMTITVDVARLNCKTVKQYKCMKSKYPTKQLDKHVNRTYQIYFLEDAH